MQDHGEAVRWYRLAAEQGLAVAQNNLGVLHEKGEGVLQDHGEAVRWYRLAAEQGHAKAQFHLGLAYHKGEGVIQDNILAHMWFNIAGSKEFTPARDMRDISAELMTRTDVSKAQQLARKCVEKNYIGC